jgi:hypothetical protein
VPTRDAHTTKYFNQLCDTAYQLCSILHTGYLIVLASESPGVCPPLGNSGLTFLTFGLVFFAGYAVAQTEQALPPPSALKKMSIEQLMDVEVTTVSRQESTVEQSPEDEFSPSPEVLAARSSARLMSTRSYTNPAAGVPLRRAPVLKVAGRLSPFFSVDPFWVISTIRNVRIMNTSNGLNSGGRGKPHEAPL